MCRFLLGFSKKTRFGEIIGFHVCVSCVIVGYQVPVEDSIEKKYGNTEKSVCFKIQTCDKYMYIL